MSYPKVVEMQYSTDVCAVVMVYFICTNKKLLHILILPITYRPAAVPH